MGLRNGLPAEANVLGEVASAKEDESEPRRGMETETGGGLLLLEEEGMSMGPPKLLLLCDMVSGSLGEGMRGEVGVFLFLVLFCFVCGEKGKGKRDK